MPTMIRSRTQRKFTVLADTITFFYQTHEPVFIGKTTITRSVASIYDLRSSYYNVDGYSSVCIKRMRNDVIAEAYDRSTGMSTLEIFL